MQLIRGCFRQTVLYGITVSALFLIFTVLRGIPGNSRSQLADYSPTVNTSHDDIVTYTPTLPLCPPGTQAGTFPVNISIPASLHTIHSVMGSSPPVTLGGRWRPKDCVSRSRLAVVMSYRGREDNLKRILQHLHPFLQQQQIEYQIFVIEPEANDVFNRGLLKNIGFVEAMKSGDFSCVVFHDIDLAPEHSLNSYHCPNMPRHLVIAIDTRKYKPLYSGAVFGGAVLFRSEHFQKINGYSNIYFDWGAEDDDLKWRVGLNKLRVSRTPTKYGRYTEFVHKKDRKRPRVNKKLYYLRSGRQNQDGLNTMRYSVREVQAYDAYTWIKVHYSKSDYEQQIAQTLQRSQKKPTETKEQATTR